jgi:hypothetical protein
LRRRLETAQCQTQRESLQQNLREEERKIAELEAQLCGNRSPEKSPIQLDNRDPVGAFDCVDQDFPNKDQEFFNKEAESDDCLIEAAGRGNQAARK